jgi:ribosome-binding factor A
LSQISINAIIEDMKKVKKSFRTEKMSSVIAKELGMIINRYASLYNQIITITEVVTSKDMKYAKVFITSLKNNPDEVLQMLKKNIYEIQGELNKSFQVKIIPRIEFVYDETPHFANEIEQKIKDALNEDTL